MIQPSIGNGQISEHLRSLHKCTYCSLAHHVRLMSCGCGTCHVQMHYSGMLWTQICTTSLVPKSVCHPLQDEYVLENMALGLSFMGL